MQLFVGVASQVSHQLWHNKQPHRKESLNAAKENLLLSKNDKVNYQHKHARILTIIGRLVLVSMACHRLQICSLHWPAWWWQGVLMLAILHPLEDILLTRLMAYQFILVAIVVRKQSQQEAQYWKKRKGPEADASGVVWDAHPHKRCTPEQPHRVSTSRCAASIPCKPVSKHAQLGAEQGVHRVTPGGTLEVSVDFTGKCVSRRRSTR
eukprot:864989-Amphidinium_carterae.1